ncbi:MAG: tol-pal system protein YbgF [Parvibaculales bacterium]
MTQKPKFMAGLIGLALYMVAMSMVGAQVLPKQNNAQGDPLSARLDALELRLAQLQQSVEAQNRLAIHDEMTQLKRMDTRLEMLEQKLDGLITSAPNSSIPHATSQGEPNAPNAPNVPNAPISAHQINQLQEILRALRGQTETLIIRYNALVAQIETANQDNEFRFQQLESAYRRATQGISSSSEGPEIIGRIKKQLPVEGQVSNIENGKLIGEGDMPTITPPPARLPLDNPNALYKRALGDLREGKFAQAEADFIAFVEKFPRHKLAGNAQYWLGESYYVRQQYKRAAEAFLAGYSQYAKNIKAPDSLLKLGMVLVALGDKKNGCGAFADLVVKFPDASDSVKRRAGIEQNRAGCNA